MIEYYLVVYLLGVATPFLFKIYVTPRLKKWMKKKTKEW